MTLLGFGSRGDQRLGELLVLLHAIGQDISTKVTATVLIVTPCRAGQISADDHLNSETLALQTYGNHRIRGGQFPVGADIGCGIQELGCNLVQNLTLERNTLGQYNVKGRYAVCGNHDHQVVINVINVTNLAVINTLLSFELEISSCQRFAHCYLF